MRFEDSQDIVRERQAVERFVALFNGGYSKLSPNDVDFKIFNESGELIAYAEVKGRNRRISEAYPLPIAARKLVKLCDKRLNPVVIWACEDGIIYGKAIELYGSARWGGRKPRPSSTNDEEFMIYLNPQDALKYVRF